MPRSTRSLRPEFLDQERVQSRDSWLIGKRTELGQLWEALEIPNVERKAFEDLWLADDSPDAARAVTHMVDWLEDLANAQVEVEKAVDTREAVLAAFARLEEMVGSDAWAAVAPDTVRDEVNALSADLRNATLAAVEAIVLWRQHMSRPFPFIWGGVNYMAKMGADLHSLIHTRLGSYLPCFVIENPLLILPATRYTPGLASPQGMAARPKTSTGARPRSRASRASRASRHDSRPLTPGSLPYAADASPYAQSVVSLGGSGLAFDVAPDAPSSSGSHAPSDNELAEQDAFVRRLVAAERLIKSERRIIDAVRRERAELLAQGLYMPIVCNPDDEPIPLSSRQAYDADPALARIDENLALDWADQQAAFARGEASPFYPLDDDSQPDAVYDSGSDESGGDDSGGGDSGGAESGSDDSGDDNASNPDIGSDASDTSEALRTSAYLRQKEFDEAEREARARRQAAATTLQASWRGYVTRRSVRSHRKRQQHDAALRIQTEYRRHAAQRRARELRKRQAAAAVIQTRYRGHAARVRAERLRILRNKEAKRAERAAEQERAATRIQANYRGHRSRKETQRKRILAAKARAHQAEQARAATRIQANYRGYVSRKEFAERRAKARAKARAESNEKLKIRNEIEVLSREEEALRKAKATVRRQMKSATPTKIPPIRVAPATPEPSPKPKPKPAPAPKTKSKSKSKSKSTKAAEPKKARRALGKAVDEAAAPAHPARPDNGVDSKANNDNDNDNNNVFLVTVTKARNLQIRSRSGNIDPFVTARFAGASHSSSSRPGDRNPAWNHEFVFPMRPGLGSKSGKKTGAGSELELTVYDRKVGNDGKSKRKVLGRASIDASLLEYRVLTPMWLALTRATKADHPGSPGAAESPRDDEILELLVFNSEANNDAEPTLLGSVTMLASHIVLNAPINALIRLDNAESGSLHLNITIKSGPPRRLAVNLIGAKGLVDSSGAAVQAFVVLKLGASSFASRLAPEGPNPSWNETFDFTINSDAFNGPMLHVELLVAPSSDPTARVSPRSQGRLPSASSTKTAATKAPARKIVPRSSKKKRKSKKPASTAEDFKIEAFQLFADEVNGPKLLITIRNTSNQTASLKKTRLRIVAMTSESRTADPLPGFEPIVVAHFSKRPIPPGDCRRLRLPWPDTLPLGPTIVTLQ